MDEIFLQIINNSLVVSVMILVIIAMRFLFRRMPKWTVCLLWAVVALRLVLPFQVESIFSLIPSGEPVPANIAMEQHPHVNFGIEVLDKGVNPIVDHAFAPTTDAGMSINPLQLYLFVASIVWIAGMIVLMVYAGVSFLVLKYKVRMSVSVQEKVYECEAIDTPFILGIIRPRIYIPCGLSEQALESVLKHEKTHLQRKDHWWKPLGFLVMMIYWFHPLCWLAYILFCRDIEYACDEKATMGEDAQWRANYCQTLLDCSMSKRMISACPVAFGEIGVKERVKSVLNYKKPAFWIVALSLVVVVGIGICLGTIPMKEVNDVSSIDNAPGKESENATTEDTYNKQTITGKDLTEDAEEELDMDEMDDDPMQIDWLDGYQDYMLKPQPMDYAGVGTNFQLKDSVLNSTSPSGAMGCHLSIPECSVMATKIHQNLIMVSSPYGTSEDLKKLLNQLQEEECFRQETFSVREMDPEGFWYVADFSILLEKEDNRYATMNLSIYGGEIVCAAIMEDTSHGVADMICYYQSRKLADYVKSLLGIVPYNIEECNHLTDIVALDSDNNRYSFTEEEMNTLRSILMRTTEKCEGCGGPYDLQLRGEDQGREIKMVLANDSCSLISIENVCYRLNDEDGEWLYGMLEAHGLMIY